MKDDLVKTMLTGACEKLWNIQSFLSPAHDLLRSLHNCANINHNVVINLTDEEKQQICMGLHLLSAGRDEIRQLIHGIGFVIGEKAMYEADHTADSGE